MQQHKQSRQRILHGAAALMLACGLLAGTTAAAAERLVDPHHPHAQDNGSGSADAPYKTLSYAMSQLKPGDHLIIAAGTYRDALVFPQKPWTRIDAATIEAAKIDAATLLQGNETVIEGRGEVLIKGSDIISGWHTVNDGVFVKPWTGDEMQQVFVDGKPLKQIGGTIFGGFPEKAGHPLLALHKTQKGIWPGRQTGNQDNMPIDSFYYDREHKSVYLKLALSDLKGHTVEISTRPEMLSGHGVMDVTVKHLNFAHSNTSTNLRSGLVMMSGLRITLEDIHIDQADSVGFHLLGDDIVLRNSSANNCGQLGLKARGKRAQLINNVTNGNNTRGFNKWWEAGGAKFIGNGGLQDSLVSGHTALNNAGDGIWFDWKNRNNTVENSFSAYNKGFGIQYEASDRARIVNNVVVGNDQRGIYLPHSSYSIVAFNLVASNGLQGIAIVDEGRRDPEKVFDFSARGNKVFGNVLAWNAGPLVLPTNIADNMSDGNIYIGDATQTNLAQGWVGMFQEALQKWTSRTQQDANSLRMENPIDKGFAKSMVEHDPQPDLSWYQSLRSKTKPIKVNAEWLKQVPHIADQRPGAALEKIPALNSADTAAEKAPEKPAEKPAQNPADNADDKPKPADKPAAKPTEQKPAEQKQPEQKPAEQKQPDDQKKP